MSFKAIFSILYSALLLLMFALAGVIYFVIQNQYALNASQQNRHHSHLLANELRQTSQDLTRYARTYVSTGDKKYEDLYWEVLAVGNGEKPREDGRTITLDDLMKEAGFTSGEFAKLKEAKNNSDSLVWTETVAMNAVKGLFDDGTKNFTVQGDPDMELARRIMFDEKYHQDVAIIMGPINEFMTMLDNRTQSQVQSLESTGYFYLWVIFGIITALIIVTVLSYYIIRVRIGKTIANLAHCVASIEKGDLTVEARAVGNDDFGKLGRSINLMVKNLNDLIQNIHQSSEQVASSSEQLTASSQSLSSTASQQASSLEETSASIEQLSSTIDSNADISVKANEYVQEANQLSLNALLVAEDGMKVIQKMSDAMNNIQDRSKEIAHVIEVIDEIADQTNLLALNAAIEAARAGDAGKGFAVVADEVRKLAERSQHAAKDITSKIKSSIHTINEGGQFASESQQGLTKIKTSSQNVADKLEEVRKLVQMISNSCQEQSEGSKQISVAVVTLDQATQQTAATSEETAAASEVLASQAFSLQERISYFKVQKKLSSASAAGSNVKNTSSAIQKWVPAVDHV